MSSAHPRVLIFDSGLGGLTIAGEIGRRLPQVERVYFGDNACFPYGTRDEAVVEQRVVHMLQTLVNRFEPDLIVLACNTASTVALPAARAAINTPIVGVVPAIKPAAERSHSRVIGLLATPGTVMRDYTANLIDTFAGHCEVIAVGTNKLVEMAENKLLTGHTDRGELLEILHPLLTHPRYEAIDTVVLACTHFPLLQTELAAAFGRPVNWVDSGAAIANRVAALLEEAGLLSGRATATVHRAVLSARPGQSARLQQELARRGFPRLEFDA